MTSTDKTLDYTIKAIPTRYGGRQYRSRLEAKWAAFFDLCEWEAEYEPFDLGSWSPDFLIKGTRCEILVEVKPITEIHVPTIYKMHTAATEAGFKGDLLLLGVCVSSERIGWLCSDEVPERLDFGRERAGYPPEMQRTPWFVPAPAVGNSNPDIRISYLYRATRSGIPYDTGLVRGTKFNPLWLGDPCSLHAKRKWNDASNAVQWMHH